MIAADITYLRPDTAEEAVDAWSRQEGARYLAGGTEITPSARRPAALDLRACIDIKRIPEANVHEMCGDRLCLGAALSLSDVAAGDAFPLLNATLRGIADHTVRNRLTLGGNVAGLLPYREAVLPLLLADATVRSIVPGQPGAQAVRRDRKLRECFDKRLILAPGELVLSFCVPIDATEWPWSHHRKTRTGPVDYPLVTTGMVRDGDSLRLAIAGAHPYPVRSDAADAALSRDGLAALPAVLEAFGALRTDSRAFAEYRVALLQNMIRAALEELA
jgi:CO/xanthine dehydrogenase FAD-binding subunit